MSNQSTPIENLQGRDNGEDDNENSDNIDSTEN